MSKISSGRSHIFADPTYSRSTRCSGISLRLRGREIRQHQAIDNTCVGRAGLKLKSTASGKEQDEQDEREPFLLLETRLLL